MTSKANSITMQPKNYDDYKDKLLYPCIAMEKLNGMKCIARWEDGDVVLRFRSNKIISTLPHINLALEYSLPDDAIVEGELYSGDLHFNELSSLIKTTSKKLDTSIVHLHLFDTQCTGGFEFRHKKLVDMYMQWESPSLHVVLYKVMDTHKDLTDYYTEVVCLGGEGVIIHNRMAQHTMGKVSTCLKLKPVHSAEFEIVGWVEGKGGLLGCIGAFQCVTKDGEVFKAKLGFNR